MIKKFCESKGLNKGFYHIVGENSIIVFQERYSLDEIIKELGSVRIKNINTLHYPTNQSTFIKKENEIFISKEPNENTIPIWYVDIAEEQ